MRERADRLTDMVERSQKVWAESLERSLDGITAPNPDPLNTLPAMTRLAQDYLDHPQKLAEATLDYWTRQTDLWTRIMQQTTGEADTGPAIEPAKGDKRFKDEMWDQ